MLDIQSVAEKRINGDLDLDISIVTLDDPETQFR